MLNEALGHLQLSGGELRLGRRLERAIQCTWRMQELMRPLDEVSWPVLELLLEISDSSMTYRSRYFTTLQPAPVLDVLMMDDANPRSLAFQLFQIVDLYGRLPRHSPEDLEEMAGVCERLRRVDPRRLSYAAPVTGEPDWDRDARAQVRELLDDLKDLLPSWSNRISASYFSHVRTFGVRIGG